MPTTSTSTETYESFNSFDSSPNNLCTEYGVYDTVHNETPYTVCAFKDEEGNLFKQYYSHTKFSPQGARYKAERDYNQYLASCAEEEMYTNQ